jgi:PAS domain-containing protein
MVAEDLPQRLQTAIAAIVAAAGKCCHCAGGPNCNVGDILLKGQPDRVAGGRNSQVLRTIRSKITILGIGALVLSLGISLPLEMLAGSRDSQVVARQESAADVVELAPAIDVLEANPDSAKLLGALFARLGRTEELYILDRAGRILTSTVDGARGKFLHEIRRPLPPDVDALLALTGPSAARTISSRAGTFTEVFARLGGGNTLLAVLSPQASAALRHVLLYHTIPPLFVGVLVLVGALWLGLNRLIMKPLRLLAESSERVVSQGEENAGIIPAELIPGDDVGEVLRLRNLMLQRLRSARRRLEEQLNQRTFELEVTHHLSGQIGHFSTDQELLEEVLVQLKPVVSWEVAAGFLVEAGQARVWARSQRPVSPEAVAQLESWLEQACLPEGASHVPVLRSLWESTGWQVSEPEGAVVDRLASCLAFPLQVDGGYVGAVVLCSVRTNAYAGHHHRIIRDVLEQGLGAVGRIRRLVAVQGRRLETVLQSMSLGVLILDPQGEITYINRKGTQHLARLEEPGETVGTHWRRSGVLAGLIGEDGGSPDVRCRITAGGTLRVTLAPFTAESDEIRGGHLVMIEELGSSE